MENKINITEKKTSHEQQKYEKKLYKSQLGTNNTLYRNTKRQLALAIYLMQNPHVNIAKYYGIRDTQDLYFIMMEKGNPIESDKFSVEQLTFKQAIKFIYDQLHALIFLEHHGIQHRDIRNQNWMFVQEIDGTKTFKLIDFGISKMNNLPIIFQQRLHGDKAFRKILFELNIKEVLGKLVLITQPNIGDKGISCPPQYMKELDCALINPYMIGKTDAWLMGIQIIRIFFKILNEGAKINKSQSLKKYCQNLELQLRKQPSKYKINTGKIPLRDIFKQCKRNKKYTYPQYDNFLDGLLTCLEHLNQMDVNKRVNARYFLVYFHKFIQEYNQKHHIFDFKQLDRFYRCNQQQDEQLTVDIQRMTCYYVTKHSLNEKMQTIQKMSQNEQNQLKRQQKYIDEIIQFQNNYLKLKYGEHHSKIQKIEKQVNEMLNYY